MANRKAIQSVRSAEIFDPPADPAHVLNINARLAMKRGVSGEQLCALIGRVYDDAMDEDTPKAERRKTAEFLQHLYDDGTAKQGNTIQNLQQVVTSPQAPSYDNLSEWRSQIVLMLATGPRTVERIAKERALTQETVCFVLNHEWYEKMPGKSGKWQLSAEGKKQAEIEQAAFGE